MSKKEIAVLSGLCTIIRAATAASRKHKWEEVHQAAAIFGGIIMSLGVLS